MLEACPLNMKIRKWQGFKWLKPHTVVKDMIIAKRNKHNAIDIHAMHKNIF